MKRENVIGRANVEDTPELEAYYRSLEGEALGALWTVANEIEPWYPQPKSVPTLWKWKKVEPFVRRAAELVSAEKAARRVVMLVNPGPLRTAMRRAAMPGEDPETLRTPDDLAPHLVRLSAPDWT